MKKLSIVESAFLDEYLVNGGSPSAAYLVAYKCSNKNAKSVASRAWALLQRPHVEAALTKRLKKITDTVDITVAEIIDQWVRIANADVNELIQHRRNCCRYCYGANHKYQWTEAQYALACAEAIALAKKNEDPKIPSNDGGFGFMPDKRPVAACPECHGRGVSEVYIVDTRDLSPVGKLMYLGIKQSRDGINIVVREKEIALQSLAKVKGMLKDKDPEKEKDNAPLSPISARTDNPVEASKIYQQVMGGK